MQMHLRVGLDVQRWTMPEPTRGVGDREPGVVKRRGVRVAEVVSLRPSGS